VIFLLAAALCLAAVLLLKPPYGAPGRLRRAAVHTPALAPAFPGMWIFSRARPAARKGRTMRGSPMTLVVQQLAALLKGGRTPARLWDELWVVYGAGQYAQPANLLPASTAAGFAPSPRQHPRGGLSPASIAVLGSARAAAASGTPVSDAIRRALPSTPAGDREARIWSELAACLDIAEASGCPLADVLTRFAAQLEVEDDADAARQTALAGPKATVSLLTWLPLMGLGLGAALGVDPLAILLGTPLGLAALAAGAALTVAGRLWSARLVAAAAGAGVP
jgi:tight adherence protein B